MMVKNHRGGMELITVDQYELIRTAHRRYGKNVSELSRMTGHSRNTIRKALNGEVWGYKERKKQPFPQLGPFLSTIDSWLVADKNEPKKQRHTARRIYNRLVTECGFPGGESTVRRYVRFAKIKLGLGSDGAFVPCDPAIGEEAEIDWGTANAVIGGKTVRLKYFCMRSKYSGKHFVRMYPCERQQAFFDAHIHGFAFFGGVFPVLIYDNLTTAVRKVLQGKQRLEQESFQRFRAYYNFDSRFCNPGQGHEKGGVEGMVGFVRRNYLVPVPDVASLEELNEKLLECCCQYGSHIIAGREQSVDVLFEQENHKLLSLPTVPFHNVKIQTGKADKYGTVIVDKNRYSLPSRYSGYPVKVQLMVDRVDLYFGGKKVASHPRLYSNNKWSLDPDHYLELIQQRPQSFESARPLRQWRKEWPQCLHKLLADFRTSSGTTSGTKDFLNVLMLYRDYDSQAVEDAVNMALKQGVSSSGAIAHILIYTNTPERIIPPVKGWDASSPPDLSVYGQLGGVQ
jgi:transposase